VVGDGVTDLRTLIERQSRRRAQATGGESTIPLDATTEEVVRDAGHSLDDVLPEGERLRVLLGDRELDMPAWVEPAMRAVRQAEEVRPAYLADSLDAQSRLVLCRRLVREGLLEVLR
jgi:hypothetical protein